jgi:hypothetical protein
MLALRVLVVSTILFSISALVCREIEPHAREYKLEMSDSYDHPLLVASGGASSGAVYGLIGGAVAWLAGAAIKLKWPRAARLSWPFLAAASTGAAAGGWELAGPYVLSHGQVILGSVDFYFWHWLITGVLSGALGGLWAVLKYPDEPKKEMVALYVVVVSTILFPMSGLVFRVDADVGQFPDLDPHPPLLLVARAAAILGAVAGLFGGGVAWLAGAAIELKWPRAARLSWPFVAAASTGGAAGGWGIVEGTIGDYFYCCYWLITGLLSGALGGLWAVLKYPDEAKKEKG